MNNNIFRVCLFVAALFICPLSAFSAPILNFSDINSGPKTGNTDTVGSGVIVTIWGNNLGSTQGASKVYVGSVEATAVYYWKDADGTLPGGPSELKTYHKMQEIAFAVPATAVDGANTIKVTVSGVDSNTLPFTVRTGGIKFVKSGGTDNGGCGSWTSPCATLGYMLIGANSKVSAGDTVYSVGIGSTTGIKVGGNGAIVGTAANPISLIAYPNTSVAISGLGGDGAVIDSWYPSSNHDAYVNFSKLKVTAYGNTTESSIGIQNFSQPRMVGLEITGPTVYGGVGGAVSGTGGYSDGGVYYGLYIHHYGYQTNWDFDTNTNTWTSPPYDGIAGAGCTNCTTVDRLQHVFYLSNRTGSPIDAYEIGWCHLTDNPALHGLHIYDLGIAGGWNTAIKVHHNVVKNQRGSAVDAMFPVSSDVEFYDNLIISDATDKNGGNPFDIEHVGGIKFYNNTVYGYRFTGIMHPTTSDYRNNIMVDTKGVSFIASTPTTHSNNLFYSTGATGQPSWAGAETGHVTGDPLFTSTSTFDFSLQSGSPALNSGYDTTATAPLAFLGETRDSSPAIGAFEQSSGDAPAQPTAIVTGATLRGAVIR